MCGIAGFLTDASARFDAEKALRLMTSALAHRGPDDSGHWLDENTGVALGHRRLSIIDLSAAGHQPMVSASGRYIGVLNGEIYNFREIRAQLSGKSIAFRGDSDTEVALAAFDVWGVEAAVQRFAGMFAFAVWDRSARALYLIRDRIGEKPLYYAQLGGVLLFGSELKSLRAHPLWNDDIDRDSVAAYLRHSFIPGTRSIYARTAKIPPGTMLRCRSAVAPPEPIQYWSASEAVRIGRLNSLPDDAQAVASGLDVELRRTLREEMLADVPLGAFLSGGIDSSLIVSLMQAESTRPVRTFTIGFDDAQFNEADHARAVASHLGTDHTEFVVTDEDARAVVPLLPTLYDEPFADSSQIPTHLVSALARKHVTVTLTGDGGDELFAGYGRYAEAARLWSYIGRMPLQIRRAAGLAMLAVPDRLLHAVGRFGRDGGPLSRIKPTPERLSKLARVISAGDSAQLYREMLTQWSASSSVVIGAHESISAAVRDRPHGLDLVEQLMLSDLTGYLPDDILVKVDRAAMGVSLESRAPFLDHRIVEFAWRIPLSLKLRDGRGKWILRELLDRYVPRQIMERPKMGFGVPLDSWLRGPLKDWADDLLDPQRLQRQGILHPAPVISLWSRYRSGEHVSGHLIWSLVMFQAWIESISSGGGRADSDTGTRSATRPSARDIVERQLAAK